MKTNVTNKTRADELDVVIARNSMIPPFKLSPMTWRIHVDDGPPSLCAKLIPRFSIGPDMALKTEDGSDAARS